MHGTLISRYSEISIIMGIIHVRHLERQIVRKLADHQGLTPATFGLGNNPNWMGRVCVQITIQQFHCCSQ